MIMTWEMAIVRAGNLVRIPVLNDGCCNYGYR